MPEAADHLIFISKFLSSAQHNVQSIKIPPVFDVFEPAPGTSSLSLSPPHQCRSPPAITMPLLKKLPFVRADPPRDLHPDSEVFFCESTREVFSNYEDFFERTILCNSMVWSCSVTGKSGLTFDEAVEAERKAKKRLGNMPRPLKTALVWLASKVS